MVTEEVKAIEIETIEEIGTENVIEKENDLIQEIVEKV